VEPFADVVAAASQLAGVQAQILSAAAVSLWNRTPHLTYAQFEKMLFSERALVKLWGQRGTLHLYPSQEWPLIQAAFDDKKTWWHRNAEQYGLDEGRFHLIVGHIVAILQEKGEIGRSDLRAADLDIADELLSSWGGLFQELVYRGYACHAGKRGNEGLFAHRQQWLPDLAWQPPPLEEANVELLRRYLAAYGPATIQDFAFWRGTGVGNGRRWLKLLRTEVMEVAVGDTTMLLLSQDIDELCEPVPEEWPLQLLYRFDPLLLAHKDKSIWLDDRFYKRVWRSAGHIEGTVVDRGRIVGTWRYDRQGSGLAVTVMPFGRLRRGIRGAIRQKAKGIAAFFEQPLSDLRYETAV
jgi:hypothetical protein